MSINPRELAEMSGQIEGLSKTEFNVALDRYLIEHTLEANAYMSMSKEQQQLIQTLKRAFKRIKNII